MDLKTLAEKLDQMPIDPYFSSSHVVVCSLLVRLDLGSGATYFSRKHPLACWLSTMVCIFSSQVLTNFLLNESVISVLGNTQQVLFATLIWYLIFYSPFDIIYRLCQFMPIKILLNCMDEIHNTKAIYQGVSHASKIFPESYFVMASIGVVKGNGPAFMRVLERLIRGSWSVSVLEFMSPSYATKMSALASLIFIANKHLEWLMISRSFVFFCVLSASIYLRLSAILLDVTDPFSPFENLICLLAFGGIWDSLAKAMASERHEAAHVNYLRARAQKADMLSRNGLRQGFGADKVLSTAAMVSQQITSAAS